MTYDTLHLVGLNNVGVIGESILINGVANGLLRISF
jgi:hypothetical protein